MFLHSDEWLWLLNIYKARLLQICSVTCFCNVYAWILVKKKLHFDFLVVFTLLLYKALSTNLPCIMIILLSVLLTGCGKKIKIVRDFGGKLCGEKHRLCGNCAGLRNLSTYQIFRDCEQELPEKYTATYCIDCSFQWYKLTRPFSALIYLRYIINITWIKT